MRAFLLLAGRSTRFWPLEEKTLFPVCGKPLLTHQIERLQAGGVNDIVLVGGPHNLEEAGALYPDLPTVEQENLELGMRGAVLSILKAYPNDELLIVSGNDVVEPQAYASLVDTSGDGALLAYEVENYFPGGYLNTDGDRITGIVEKPGEGNEPSNVVNIVAHVHRDPQALLAALQDVNESTDDGYEQALDNLFTSHWYVAARYSGAWQAVKFPWHILELNELLLSHITEPRIHSDADIHETAIINGPVIIEEGARVLPHAVINGPSYIGKRSVVANNALVRGSSVGDDCVVGYNTEIKGSVLHSHVWTHMNYIGDSVIGHNVSFGGGTVTGNFRLDEAPVTSVVKGEKLSAERTKFGCVVGNNSRLGIHVSTNPGVKIGSGCFVSSQVLVASDVENNQFVVTKNGTVETRENRTEVSTPEDREKYKKKL